MFNIIETPRNYFTCKLLHDNLSSNVAFHFNVSHWRSYLVVSYSEEVFCRPSTAPGVCTSNILITDISITTHIALQLHISNLNIKKHYASNCINSHKHKTPVPVVQQPQTQNSSSSGHWSVPVVTHWSV